MHFRKLKIALSIFVIIAAILIVYIRDVMHTRDNLKLICSTFCPECYPVNEAVGRSMALQCISVNMKEGLSRKEVHSLFSRAPICKQEKTRFEHIETWICSTSSLLPHLQAPVALDIFYNKENKITQIAEAY